MKGLFGLFSRKAKDSATMEPEADETPTGPVPVLSMPEPNEAPNPAKPRQD